MYEATASTSRIFLYNSSMMYQFCMWNTPWRMIWLLGLRFIDMIPYNVTILLPQHFWSVVTTRLSINSGLDVGRSVMNMRPVISTSTYPNGGKSPYGGTNTSNLTTSFI